MIKFRTKLDAEANSHNFFPLIGYFNYISSVSLKMCVQGNTGLPLTLVHRFFEDKDYIPMTVNGLNKYLII